MDFCEWLRLDESSLNDLFNSTVAAFPNTTKRQHAVGPVVIAEIRWTPYLGMRTLFVRGLAQSGDKEYNPIIVFKGVQYHPQKDQENRVEIVASDGNHYVFEKLSYANNDVLVRCDCKDFYWRFNYFDHLDDSLYGRKRAAYTALVNPGSANPLEMPGMCKHLMKLAQALDHANALED